jgi:GNAT superfamily N-acetyltransferase
MSEITFRHHHADTFSHIIAYCPDYVGALKYSRPNMHSIFIDELQVSQAYRGRGYGMALLRNLYECTPEVDCYSLVAREHYDNWGHLEAFYERAGFRSLSEREAWAGGEHYREIVMERRKLNADTERRCC